MHLIFFLYFSPWPYVPCVRSFPLNMRHSHQESLSYVGIRTTITLACFIYPEVLWNFSGASQISLLRSSPSSHDTVGGDQELFWLLPFHRSFELRNELCLNHLENEVWIPKIFHAVCILLRNNIVETKRNFRCKLNLLTVSSGYNIYISF